MQNSFFQAICRMGIFMICVRAIIHFRPNETYEKYLRLLAGILIMIQLFLPVGKLFLGKGGREAAQVLQEFRRELEMGMEEAAESAEAADAILEQMTLEEIQRRLEEQALEDRETGAGDRETEAGGEETEAEDRETGAGDRETEAGGGETEAEDRETKAEGGETEPKGGGREAEDGGGRGVSVRVEEIEPVSIEPLP